ncbi:MAG: response regulator transcription factor [Lachnospiraceae bacterium]|nr:response regulator transcription factor [Lachnospiraceae bacterium]
MPTEFQLNIAVCDDIQADRATIIGMTIDCLREAGVLYSISEYESAEALLVSIRSGEQFHILLLDVLMDEMSGMELAAELRRQGNKTAIVFISSNREMALCGYEVSAARFLGKPVELAKLQEALQYCIRSLPKKKEILLPTELGEYRIDVSEIQYAEAFERGTRFVLNHEIVESRLKFGEVESVLSKGEFILCHRAYIINLSRVRYIRRYEFVMKNGEIIPISRRRFAEIYHKYMDYIVD